jgi:hypothetical protein
MMKKFRHIIEIALNKEWIYRNPFKEFNLQWQKVDRGYLTQSELAGSKTNGRSRHAIFLFSECSPVWHTQMLSNLTNKHIQSSFDSKLWIRGKREKTGTEYNIPVLNIPKMILEKYRGKANDDLALPVFKLAKYNTLLKKVAQLCGIDKNVSSHLVRHSILSLGLGNRKLQKLNSW